MDASFSHILFIKSVHCQGIKYCDLNGLTSSQYSTVSLPMTNYFYNYRCKITITITITENSVMITANYNYKLPLPQHRCKGCRLCKQHMLRIAP